MCGRSTNCHSWYLGSGTIFRICLFSKGGDVFTLPERKSSKVKAKVSVKVLVTAMFSPSCRMFVKKSMKSTRLFMFLIEMMVTIYKSDY